MRICLINPPTTITRNEDFEYDHTFCTLPHLGIGYIGAVLEERGFEVDIYECIGQEISMGELFKTIEDKEYDAIGISTYYYNYIYVANIIKKVKRMKPSTFIFVGGYFPTLSYEQVLKTLRGVDCCIVGEGEYTCLELMGALLEKRDWKDIQGIAYKENDKIIITELRPLIENLDDLPIPKRAFIAKRKMTALVTSRGCYGRCIYCGTREFYERFPGKIVRRRSPEKVAEEIEYLINNYGIKYVHINDDNFLVGSRSQKEWLKKFYNILKGKKLKISGRFFARANEIISNQDFLHKLIDIGINSVFIGIESLVQRQLDFYNKKVTVQQNIDAINIACDAGMKINAGFMMFEPFTTIDEIIKNVTLLSSTKFCEHVVEEHLPISAKIPAAPITGTTFYDYMVDRGLLTTSDLNYEFQDEKTTLCYEIIKLWNKKVLPVHFMHYLITKAYENNEFDLSQSLSEEKHWIMRHDLNFIKELAIKVKNNEITLDDGEEYVSKWAQPLQMVSEKFQTAKEALKKYD